MKKIIYMCSLSNMFGINAYARGKIRIDNMSEESPAWIVLMLLITGFIWLLWRFNEETDYIKSTSISIILGALGYISSLVFLSVLASIIFGFLF